MNRAELIEKICYADYKNECSAFCGEHTCSDCKEAIEPLLDEYEKQIRAEVIEEALAELIPRRNYYRSEYEHDISCGLSQAIHTLERLKEQGDEHN